MNKIFKGLMVLSSIMCLAGAALAQTPTDELSTCLADNLSGKERKSLAKWIFFSIASHPEIKVYSRATPQDQKLSDQYMGSLITRLLTADCADALKKAYSADPMSVQKAFEVVGRVAMQELLNSPDVQRSISSYAQFADTEKIHKVLGKK